MCPFQWGLHMLQNIYLKKHNFRIPAEDSRRTVMQGKKRDMNEKFRSFAAALPRWRGKSLC